MSAIAITTSQNIDLSYQPAGVGKRMVATLIDFAIIFAYFIVFAVFLGVLSIKGTSVQFAIFGLGLPVYFYNLLSELFLNGQSVGKRAMHIKVISLNGKQPNAGQYLIRWLFRVIDIYIAFALPGIITISVSKSAQRLGDLVAGTTVVSTKPITNWEQTMFVPNFQENYQPAYPEVTNLADKDIQLIKEVLLNVQKSGNTMLALEAMRKLETLLAIKSKHDPITFLYAIISDYNYLSVQTEA